MQGKRRGGASQAIFGFRSSFPSVSMALPIRSSVLRLGDSSHEDRSKEVNAAGKKGKGKGNAAARLSPRQNGTGLSGKKWG